VIELIGQLTSERLHFSSFLEGEHFIFPFKALFFESNHFLFKRLQIAPSTKQFGRAPLEEAERSPSTGPNKKPTNTYSSEQPLRVDAVTLKIKAFSQVVN